MNPDSGIQIMIAAILVLLPIVFYLVHRAHQVQQKALANYASHAQAEEERRQYMADMKRLSEEQTLAAQEALSIQREMLAAQQEMHREFRDIIGRR